MTLRGTTWGQAVGAHPGGSGRVLQRKQELGWKLGRPGLLCPWGPPMGHAPCLSAQMNVATTLSRAGLITTLFSGGRPHCLRVGSKLAAEVHAAGPLTSTGTDSGRACCRGRGSDQSLAQDTSEVQEDPGQPAPGHPQGC